MAKSVTILGSTGSIGKSTLQVARHLGDALEVTALAAHSNIELLEAQAREFSPRLVAVYDKDKAFELQRRMPQLKVVAGEEGLAEVAKFPDADIVVSAMVGSAGLKPTLQAIEAGKNIALANKEVLVAAGEIVTAKAREKDVALLPVDSEHSAIFQCLLGGRREEVRRLILTASGGPFRNYNVEQLEKVTLDDALRHPTWNMGPKVTVDSSTLMNKGLEVIEAYWLFGLNVENIEVVVHPQSIVHSMVEFRDRSTIAQLSNPDMVLPIQYALTYPDRQEGYLKPLDFSVGMNLEFSSPDTERFICLQVAYDALTRGGTTPCYMNAANEVLVQRFIEGEIRWSEIGQKLYRLVHDHQTIPSVDLDTILAVDCQARLEAQNI
ncbi:MAG: 1-deoxy-D-xylulose-5-phosphate reductoisomerase [Chlamydiota bacterium]